MVTYTCPNCNRVFNRKSSFIDHTENKKYPCKPNNTNNSSVAHTGSSVAHNSSSTTTILDDINSDKAKHNVKIFTCTNCSKEFKKKFNLTRHLISCNKLNQTEFEEDKNKDKLNNLVNIEELDVDEKTKIILTLLLNQNKKIIEENKKIIEENKEMKEKISNMDKKKGSKTINNTNNTINTTNSNNSITNNTQNNNNTINNTIILAHGKEELNKIELDAIMSCMSTIKHREIIPNITKHVYLNDAKPENKNFCVVDMARNKCKYYDGDKWLVGKTNDRIGKIFDNVHNMLTDPFEEENIEKTTKFIKDNPKKFNQKWIKISNTYLKSLYDEDDKENIENKTKVLNELKLIFFNNREEILKIK